MTPAAASSLSGRRSPAWVETCLEVNLTSRPDAVHRLLAVLHRKNVLVQALHFVRGVRPVVLVVGCEEGRLDNVLSMVEREPLVLECRRRPESLVERCPAPVVHDESTRRPIGLAQGEQLHRRGAEPEPELVVRPMSGTVGAEISGVDLAEMGDATVRAVRDVWLKYGVVCFRDQDLSPTELVAVARRFGRPARYPFVPGLPECPEVIEVKKLPGERTNFGGIWHSDTAYLDQPPTATILLAREVPPAGGDTQYSDMRAAYAALSPAMRDMIDPLNAVNTSALADVSATREDRLPDSAHADDTVYEAVHPVVRAHPETGTRALYVNVAHTSRFEGMTEEESRGLLEFLFRHQVRPEFTCRLTWQPGTLAMWDNRCVQHNPVNDYHGHLRVMHRVTIV